ncbi:glycosyltransferase [Leuconostoc citreum]|uniref:Glycosyltransferase n=1 Tax=Leuconostoc citreum TaxID=33964 RepID=A0A5A5U0Z7_LEUCI|nr:glycosyltransferase [Leuconostoc citreum]MCT3067589.1 glycosyltransferase [Leuconostoc citreum]TDG66629.1 hypothetical protein C5L21_001655 [Leuconostoc citreum]GDZ84751.1 hypothetical protein LCIT_19930 [Leuconostoc citreum]GDZ85219.1 hypothetical protein LCTS_04180 [Leuconostoc citreum]
MIEFVTLVVTYGSEDRVHNLVKTINSALKQGTQKVFVVSNGAQYDIVKFLSIFENKVDLIKYDFNVGSAGGFGGGITEILKSKEVNDETYILILDDDVKVDDGFSKKLEKLESKFSWSSHIWSMLRRGRDSTFSANWDRSMESYRNSIAGFSLRNKVLLPKKQRKNIEVAEPTFITWAGVVAQKSVLKNVELPNEDFFVYEDDAQFSLNAQRKGIKIRKSKNLTLSEIGESWFEDKKRNSGYRIFYKSPSDEGLGRFLYMLRNNVYLIRNNGLLTSHLIYFTNLSIFVTFGFIRYGHGTFRSMKRLVLVMSAIHDGWSGHLGQNINWKL